MGGVRIQYVIIKITLNSFYSLVTHGWDVLYTVVHGKYLDTWRESLGVRGKMRGVGGRWESAKADRGLLGYIEGVLRYMGECGADGGVLGCVGKGRADRGVRWRMARGSTWVCAGADRGHIRVHVRSRGAYDMLGDFNSTVDTPFEAGC